ncbi:Reverse transcriptase precursor [Phytophthora megakarya]|uniref:Reverse transcriptase n=1 Tax=Phytophthora megakarya TaxID=4795 RepID=A0A225V383_9STRA|nr:Reverse transcriptase precursor [Phytophthora megakarya]
MEVEVRQAINFCKPGKAPGPDMLGNDWYREYADLLTPILGRLFNMWFGSGVFPKSFLEADIFCIKKSGNSSNPLNYRPIALLNTDYKLFTRILANRVSCTLRDCIHGNQNGFVPGRTIHSTLNLFAAAQCMAQADEDMEDAVTLLLDFQKAYDSLDRTFLVEALRKHGYPEQFVQAVAKLHAGTTARFLANGERSRRVSITCGIRQGCPLAPLLFILALDPLYRQIDLHPDISGVVLHSTGGHKELRVVGFADDTTVYLRTAAKVAILLTLTPFFGQASGLLLNELKTLVIALNPRAHQDGAHLPAPLQFMDKSHHGRYLGVQVGSTDGSAATWIKADAQLALRLRLAMQKTMTVDQRSVIAAAIIVPKLLFIAQHAWPTAAHILSLDRKICNFV